MRPLHLLLMREPFEKLDGQFYFVKIYIRDSLSDVRPPLKPYFREPTLYTQIPTSNTQSPALKHHTGVNQ